MSREKLEPDGLYDATAFQYVHAIVDDGDVYISGQTATGPEGSTVGDDAEAQTRQAFANLEIILDHVGKEFDDVVKITSYLVDLPDTYDGFKTVYREYFENDPPCHTMLGVDCLAREDLLVEIDVEVT